MLLMKSGRIKTYNGFDKVVNVFNDKYRNGKKLELKNEIKNGVFCLKIDNLVFGGMLVLVEIKGQIRDDEISYKIKVVS